ncbi:MAG: di-trans,poly-cis-decaprenylcistransferase [Gammaproteobacteria bacterium RIFCSPHIGHO2_12_FULL_42_13]|nr:MAG: di-trans,poly-cis-decaprenylcistransferase [Gammaproteobacteria bacterium RIFCSPHIGHO2_12_FULL_42_13]
MMSVSPLSMPSHVAVIMDGNGRWAKQRHLPRAMGHRAGVKSVRRAITFCIDHHIPTLTLFALSVENYLMRPALEVQFLTALLSESLLSNLKDLEEQKVCVRVIGDLSVFPEKTRSEIADTESRTKNNCALTLVLAINYSGRWDILQAAKQFAVQHQNIAHATEADFSRYLCLQDLSPPDLLIRTGGEQRISNFLLWQLAYTELYFAEVMWPGFDDKIFQQAIEAFQKRERRFGLTGEQVQVC